MDELVEMVSEKADISEEQATQAVDTVKDYLKEHLEPIADQIEGALSSDVDAEDLKEDLEGMLGGKE